MSFADALRAAFPIETERFSLHLADPTTDHQTGAPVPGIRTRADGSTIATVQLIVREPSGGKLSVRDIKEQEVVVLEPKHQADPRRDAYVAGWRDAVFEVFTEQEALLKRDPEGFARFKNGMETLMPHDLFVPKLLDLKRARDRGAFREALLSNKRRFGRLLP